MKIVDRGSIIPSEDDDLEGGVNNRIRNTAIGENIGMTPIVVMFCDIYEVSCLVIFIFNDPSYMTE